MNLSHLLLLKTTYHVSVQTQVMVVTAGLQVSSCSDPLEIKLPVVLDHGFGTVHEAARSLGAGVNLY